MRAHPEFSLGAEDDVMNEINMIPFIDVMLVLLIVFIITVPIITHSVEVKLPRASSEKEVVEPETINLAIKADGSYWIADAAFDDEALEARLQRAAAEEPQPQLHIRGDQDARYERVARAMAAAKRAGLNQIGFVTQPTQPEEP